MFVFGFKMFGIAFLALPEVKKEVTGLSCNNKIGAGVFCSNKALGLVKALRMK